jgi:3-oxoacyl-[acyl-carrier protein] reductase
MESIQNAASQGTRGNANMGKIAIVTGANHGIGEAIARELAANGYKVVITWLNPDDYAYSKSRGVEMLHTMGGKAEAIRVVDSIVKNGGLAESIPVDLSRTESVFAVFDLAEKVFGPVDTLINNAAHAEGNDTLERCDSEVIDRTYAVNVRASILLTQEFVKRYRKSNLKKGAVVNISTNAAQYFAGEIHYGATKAAMEAYTRSLSIELGGYGIRVNAVAPGPVHTGIPKSYITPELEEMLNKRIPLGRCGQPVDIARAVRFLVSEDADWITGQVLCVDGGHSWGRCVW